MWGAGVPGAGGLRGEGRRIAALHATEARLLVRYGVIHGSDSGNSSKTACELVTARTEVGVVL